MNGIASPKGKCHPYYNMDDITGQAFSPKVIACLYRRSDCTYRPRRWSNHTWWYHYTSGIFPFLYIHGREKQSYHCYSSPCPCRLRTYRCCRSARRGSTANPCHCTHDTYRCPCSNYSHGWWIWWAPRSSRRQDRSRRSPIWMMSRKPGYPSRSFEPQPPWQREPEWHQAGCQ